MFLSILDGLLVLVSFKYYFILIRSLAFADNPRLWNIGYLGGWVRVEWSLLFADFTGIFSTEMLEWELVSFQFLTIILKLIVAPYLDENKDWRDRHTHRGSQREKDIIGQWTHWCLCIMKIIKCNYNKAGRFPQYT